MKKITVVTVLLVCLTLPFYGCRPVRDGDDEKPEQRKSSVRLLADGVTGKSALDAGARAKEDIQAIAEQRNAMFDEVLQE